jgi:hypothetical protein
MDSLNMTVCLYCTKVGPVNPDGLCDRCASLYEVCDAARAFIAASMMFVPSHNELARLRDAVLWYNAIREVL